MSAEPTAAESIAAELAKAEKSFAPWFTEDIDVPPADVLGLADELGFEPDEKDEDESADDYAERIFDDAVTHIRDARDDEGKLEERLLGVYVTVTITMRVEISTGGPADYITAEIDPETREMSDVRYHFAPWFDHADVPVDSDSPLYHVAARFASYYDNGGSVADLIAGASNS